MQCPQQAERRGTHQGEVHGGSAVKQHLHHVVAARLNGNVQRPSAIQLGGGCGAGQEEEEEEEEEEDTKAMCQHPHTRTCRARPRAQQLTSAAMVPWEG